MEEKENFINDMKELWKDRHKIIAEMTPMVIFILVCLIFFAYIVAPKLNTLSPFTSEYWVYVIAMIGLIDSRFFMKLISKPCYYLFKRMKWLE
jgi:hypothetical protein